MKKIIILSAFLILASGCLCSGQGGNTIIKGKVRHWPTDTVYLSELPFHSPYSNSYKFQTISKDSIFNFQIKNKNKPFVFFISPDRQGMDHQIKYLLYNNVTDQHYYGHCIKVYTYGMTTYLIEPETILDIHLTYNSWQEKLSPKQAERMKKLGVKVSDDNTVRDIGKTKIEFVGSEEYKNSYYQKSFNLDDKFDKALERVSSKNVNMAIVNLENTRLELLIDLESNKDKLSQCFYDYIKTEIEFGAKKEFLKYLRFEKEDYLKEIINTGEIPEKFAEILAFEKLSITDAVLINEEYNEYIELYLNFMLSMDNREYVEYHPFSMEKLQLAMEELPEGSRYYYIANQLLHTQKRDEFASIIEGFIVNFPSGELNGKLKEKYGVK